uniref:Uncharacterized protein n=1 Tax=Panagrolaimus davidi TaxID=227884 RepID=A0A914PL70_9BILA
MKIHKLILPSNPSPSNLCQYFNFENCYRDLSYHEHPPPFFEYFLRDVSNFEAMIYYALNSTKIFFGETIAILIPKNKEVYIYIFRRILLHFILENNFVVSINFEITSTFLNFPQSIAKIIVKPFPNLKINEKCQEIKTLPEILMKGFKFYEKSENEKALAICGTPKYLQVLEKAGLKSLLKPIYSDIIPKIVPTNEMKKVVIEIKENAIRVSIMAKISTKKFNTIFKYPDNGEFIPMYISFLRETVVIGKQAIKDYETHPKFVVFGEDFL